MASRQFLDRLGCDQVHAVLAKSDIADVMHGLASRQAEFAILGLASGVNWKGRLLSVDRGKGMATICVHHDLVMGPVDRDVTCCFETTTEQGWFGFTASPRLQSVADDSLLWTVPLPARLVCLERRGEARTRLPNLPAVTCAVPVSDSPGDVNFVRAHVIDISWGGIALRVPGRNNPLVAGRWYRGCKFMLTPTDSVEMNIEVVSVSAIACANGDPAYRVNCKWIVPSGWALAQVKRYIARFQQVIAPRVDSLDDLASRRTGSGDR